MCINIFICVEVNNGKESDRIEKNEKQSYSKVMNLLRKLRLKCFGFNEPSSLSDDYVFQFNMYMCMYIYIYMCVCV